MRNDLKGHIIKIAGFLNKNLDEATVDKILKHVCFDGMKDQSKTLYSSLYKHGLYDPSKAFVRKGTTGNWTEYFTKEQHEYIERSVLPQLIEHGLNHRLKILV